MLVSRHFTVAEFACRDGSPYPADWIPDRLTALCSVLDTIREAWGAPLIVVSGYRSPAYNAAIAAESAARNGVSGVASASQHVQGRAADVKPTDATPERVAELWRVAKRLYAAGQTPALGGLGVYGGWIHVDVRAKVSGHLAQWTGAGVDATLVA